MRKTLNNIETACVQVNAGAASVADTSTQLAHGVSGQTIALKKLSEDITAIIDQVHETGERTIAARGLAGSAKKKIEESSRDMNRLLEAMNEISRESSEIAMIIQTIDDIAFQTNILALNASIEAAHLSCSVNQQKQLIAEQNLQTKPPLRFPRLFPTR